MTPHLSIIVATVGRDTLQRALRSVNDQPLLPGDEVLVVGDSPEIERVANECACRYIRCPVGGNFAYAERQHAMPLATGTHLLFLDDDDRFLPGAFAAIRSSIQKHPDRPLMFRMIAPWGQTGSIRLSVKLTTAARNSSCRTIPRDSADGALDTKATSIFASRRSRCIRWLADVGRDHHL